MKDSTPSNNVNAQPHTLRSWPAFHGIEESTNDLFGLTDMFGLTECAVHLEWHLQEFVEVELNDCWNLGALLTLSGTVDSAYATTCENYISLFWGPDGLAVLETIKNQVMNHGEMTLSLPHLW